MLNILLFIKHQDVVPFVLLKKQKCTKWMCATCEVPFYHQAEDNNYFKLFHTEYFSKPVVFILCLYVFLLKLKLFY